MKTALLAIYIVAAWPQTVQWHEYQIIRVHFFSAAVCERYRPKLVAIWAELPPLANVMSSRCGPWAPNSDFGEDL